MHLRLFHFFLVATVVVSSAAFASADEHEAATINVHPSRRLPGSPGGGLGGLVRSNSGKELPVDDIANAMKKADDKVAASVKNVDKVDEKAKAATKAAKADDVADDVDALKKMPEEDLNKLATDVATMPPKHKSKVGRAFKWLGYSILGMLALYGTYQLTIGGGERKPPAVTTTKVEEVGSEGSQGSE